MIGDLLLQDPAETLDHSFDWTDWLAGDTISMSTWKVSPQVAGVPTLSGQANTSQVTTTFLAGVIFGQVYQLSNKIVTAAGRTGERSMTIQGFAE